MPRTSPPTAPIRSSSSAIGRHDDRRHQLANVRRGIVQAGTVGYWVGQPLAHRGYMTTALRVLLPSLFGELNRTPSRPPAFPPMPPSIRVLEKCGFTREAGAALSLASTGSGRIICLFGLLHEDFRG